MNGILFILLVVGSSVHGAAKRSHDGPPLFICDIYINGKFDSKNWYNLFTNIQKAYPILTSVDIQDCITYCEKHKELDIIEECQNLMLWKAAHLKDIKNKKSCFKEYKQQ